VQITAFLIFYVFYDIICVGDGEEVAFRGYFYSTIKPRAKGMDARNIFGALVWHMACPNTLNIMNVFIPRYWAGYALLQVENKKFSLLSHAPAHDCMKLLLQYIYILL
jgi:hypothetical protein